MNSWVCNAISSHQELSQGLRSHCGKLRQGNTGDTVVNGSLLLFQKGFMAEDSFSDLNLLQVRQACIALNVTHFQVIVFRVSQYISQRGWIITRFIFYVQSQWLAVFINGLMRRKTEPLLGTVLIFFWEPSLVNCCLCLGFGWFLRRGVVAF